MLATFVARAGRAAAIALAAGMLAQPALAQPQPPAPAVALGRELIEVKGERRWDSIVPFVIDQVREVFLLTDPTLGKDLDEVAQQLGTDYAPRTEEFKLDVAGLYAQRFTEQELKELVAFYKSPLGKKEMTEEPRILDAANFRAQQWSASFSEEVMARMRAEMKKRGHNL
jgi:hypothetical protein